MTDTAKPYVLLLPTAMCAPFVAWGERMAPVNGSMGRIRLIKSWNLQSLAVPAQSAPANNGAFMYFEQWDETWGEVILCYLNRLAGGLWEVEFGDRDMCQEVFEVEARSMQLWLRSLLENAGLSEARTKELYTLIPRNASKDGPLT
jgi:hypothetical protein